MGGYATGAGVPSAESWFNNLSIASATTTNANDSIKITSGDGSALSAGNAGWVDLPSTTAGRTTRFKVTADVTILLTGATWGFGGTGDLTGELLRVLAINDNGTLRWGVALLGGRNTLLTTDTNATQANVNLAEEVLCNTAVGSATNSCRELGFFRSNFDDTGGAAEDLWANQTGVNDIYTGITADGYWAPWNPGYTGFSANPSDPSGAVPRMWTQNGRTVTVALSVNNGTSNTTGFTITNLPIKARRIMILQGGSFIDNGAAVFDGWIETGADTAILTLYKNGSAAGWTAASTKGANFVISYPAGPEASFIT